VVIKEPSAGTFPLAYCVGKNIENTKPNLMTLPKQIAERLRLVYFGYNWSSTNLKEQLTDTSLGEATTQVGDLNTIASLAYHMCYYLRLQTKVLQGGPLEGNDKESWQTPEFATEAEWNSFLEQSWEEAEAFAKILDEMPEEKLWSEFANPKYKTVFYNVAGMIEHFYYHLGQIVLIKKQIQG
jgi:uncharacterized damage-inducible protein DinB